MGMTLRAIFPVGLVAVSVLAMAAVQGITLKRTPKVGDKASFKISGKFEVQGVEAVLSGTANEEITSVDADKYTTKTTTKSAVNVMGQDMEQPDTEETTVYKLDNTVVSSKRGEQSADAYAMRLNHLNVVYLPGTSVKVDDTWTLEGKKDDTAGTPGYKITYKLVGEEKVGDFDTYKLSAEGGETDGEQPTKIKSTIWINKADGATIHTVSDITDAKFQEQFPAVSGKMEVTRVP